MPCPPKPADLRQFDGRVRRLRRRPGSTSRPPAFPIARGGGLPGRRTGAQPSTRRRCDRLAHGGHLRAGTDSQSRGPRARQDDSGAGAGWLNLIHVDDAASVVLAAERAEAGPRHYLVSGLPGPRAQYYRQLALLLMPAPQFLVSRRHASLGSARESDKRISNSRLMSELGVRLAYPSFREGLAGIVSAD